MLNRRGFLSRSGVLAALAAGGAPHLAHSAETLNARSGSRPRRIIHVVSDGLSAGTLSCADHYSQIFRKRRLAWMDFLRLPDTRHGLMVTRSTSPASTALKRPAMSISLSKWPMLHTMALCFIFRM